jgi:hypothetical protein
VMPWARETADKPKQTDFKAWVEHVCLTILSGHTHEHRRHLFKTLLDEAWRFADWLTHTKSST